MPLYRIRMIENLDLRISSMGECDLMCQRAISTGRYKPGPSSSSPHLYEFHNQSCIVAAAASSSSCAELNSGPGCWHGEGLVPSSTPSQIPMLRRPFGVAARWHSSILNVLKSKAHKRVASIQAIHLMLVSTASFSAPRVCYFGSAAA